MRIIGEVMTGKNCVGKRRERIRNQTVQEFERSFWSKVIAGNNSCILWVGTKTDRGYGSMWHPFKKSMRPAHRVAFEIEKGEIEKGKEVCHKCDNPSCVNPNHLFVGSHTDNMVDMTNKGRNVAFKGESNGSSKLTEAQVLEIRGKYIPWKYGTIKLSKEYGVSQPLIMGIVSGKTWKHVQ